MRLAEQNAWLKKNRPPSERARLRDAVRRFREIVGANPGSGYESEKVGTITFRALALPGLPLIVWYYFDEGDPGAPVWLTTLWHESQDREGVDPSRYV